MEKGEDCIANVNKIKNLANKLVVVDKSLYKENVVMTLLSSLLDSYSSLIVALEYISRKDLSLDYIIIGLVNELTKIKKRSPLESNQYYSYDQVRQLLHSNVIPLRHSIFLENQVLLLEIFLNKE